MRGHSAPIAHKSLKHELSRYKPGASAKPCIVVANKSDVAAARAKFDALSTTLRDGRFIVFVLRCVVSAGHDIVFRFECKPAAVVFVSCFSGGRQLCARNACMQA